MLSPYAVTVTMVGSTIGLIIFLGALYYLLRRHGSTTRSQAPVPGSISTEPGSISTKSDSNRPHETVALETREPGCSVAPNAAIAYTSLGSSFHFDVHPIRNQQPEMQPEPASDGKVFFYEWTADELLMEVPSSLLSDIPRRNNCDEDTNEQLDFGSMQVKGITIVQGDQEWDEASEASTKRAPHV